MATEVEPYENSDATPQTPEQRLRAAADFVSGVADTTTSYTRDMHALGISPVEAVGLLACVVVGVVVLAALL